MGLTSIEWVRSYREDGTFTRGMTVNPIKARDRKTGAIGHYCERVSPGCGRCYAAEFQPRFGLPTFAGVKQRAERLAMLELFVDEKALRSVLRRRQPTRIFWEDMADLFGPWVSIDKIARCVAMMCDTSRHTHLLLTKHPRRMASLMLSRDLWFLVRAWLKGNHLRAAVDCGIERRPPNGAACMWLGVTVCNQAEADKHREPMRRLHMYGWQTWVSYEPALEPVDWSGWGFVKQIVAGGESGNRGPRPSHPQWFRDTRDFCAASNISFFFKQWGAWRPKLTCIAGDPQPIAKGDNWGTLDSLGNWFPLATPWNGRQDLDSIDNGELVMVRVGKKAAGRLLDGREHSEFPKARSQESGARSQES